MLRFTASQSLITSIVQSHLVHGSMQCTRKHAFKGLENIFRDEGLSLNDFEKRDA